MRSSNEPTPGTVVIDIIELIGMHDGAGNFRWIRERKVPRDHDWNPYLFLKSLNQNNHQGTRSGVSKDDRKNFW